MTPIALAGPVTDVGAPQARLAGGLAWSAKPLGMPEGGLRVQLLVIRDVSLAVRTVLKELAPSTDDRGDRTGGPRRGRGRPVKFSRGTAAPDHTSFSHT
jgi:hypothetical protein